MTDILKVKSGVIGPSGETSLLKWLTMNASTSLGVNGSDALGLLHTMHFLAVV